MSHKANISMNAALYAWLGEVGSRIGSRSVPGTARAILQAVMRAASSADAAVGMVSVIDSLRPREEDAADEEYISGMMEELSDLRDTSQSIHIRRRT